MMVDGAKPLTPTIISIQVGQAKTYECDAPQDGKGRSWRSAFLKSPVAGPVRATRLGLAGDEQADRQNHGGSDKALLAYAADHYAHWRLALGLAEMPPGSFGENLTIRGLAEQDVCIGDRWRAGTVEFEVSQPRQPCWKMGRRWNRPDLPKQVIQNGRSGWYVRVVIEGDLFAGTALALVARPRPTWTIARASRLLYHERTDLAGLEELAGVPELSHAWREELLERLARQSR